ncbi:MAG: FAD-dependent thymidylate synthase [Caldisericia bacterium]
MKSNDTRLTLLTGTDDPQRICTLSARVSTLPGKPTEIFEKTPEGGHPDSLRRIIGMGHKSVSEHANFTIAFENVSVFVEQYMITHRLASFTVKSRRYVSHADAGYIVPYLAPEGENDLWGNTDKPYVGPEFYGPLSQRYVHYCEGLFLAYKKLLDIGIPPEDARFVLPYSFKSNFILTANARTWIHIIYDAIHGRGAAFPEVTWIGSTLQKMLSRVAPAMFSKIEAFEFGKARDLDSISKLVTKKDDVDMSMGVDIIANTPNPDRTLTKAAIMADTAMNSDEVDEVITDEIEVKVIEEVLKHRHARELEQVNFTFSLRGMSLPTLTHLVRHRIQSIIIPNFSNLYKCRHIIEPESIRKMTEAHSVFKAAVNSHDSFSLAMDRFDVRPENRVYTLLSGQAINVVTTINARELIHFLLLRTCNRAQWEIRDYADKMLFLLKSKSSKDFLAGPDLHVFFMVSAGKNVMWQRC